jgi:UDP-GlcNAc:undecaprenyl-phosphate/decaprenyl-phosphate GlcNAc-1-phosphate transferase
MPFHLIFAFVLPAVITLLCTPLVMRLAIGLGAIDKPNARKAHTIPTPRLGGVAVFVSFAISLAVLIAYDHDLTFPSWILGTKGFLLYGSIALVLALGIWDDMRELKAGQKFLVQLVLASVAYLAGFNISGITHPFTLGVLPLGVFDYAATVVWIIGVTNAINLIDGLDGLAAGVSTIALLTMFPIAIIQNDMGTAVVALVLAGAVFGFLRYNFNPAKIFLGDSGSLFIGFMLAILSTQSSTKSSTAFSFLVAVLALGLPIMDTLLSMLRRMLQSTMNRQRNPGSRVKWLRAMFIPDRRHIHHQLLARGLSHRRTVLVLYLVSCALGLGAFAVTVASNVEVSFVLIVVGLAIVIGIRQLRYREIAVLRNGALLPLFQHRMLTLKISQVFLDIFFIMVAYSGAHLVDDATHMALPVTPELVFRMSIVCFVQFIVFWLRGTYKFAIREFGLSDALDLTKTTIIACGVGAIVLAAVRLAAPQVEATVLLLDFYFLITLTIGSRFSFQLLTHLFQRNTEEGQRVLIHGADRDGATVLQRILESTSYKLRPAGFLDDRPSVEGKRMNGYPILGGHWKLEQFVKKIGVTEIVLASENIKPEILRRLAQKAEVLGVSIRRFTIHLEELPLQNSIPLPGRQRSGAGEKSKTTEYDHRTVITS